MSIWMDVLGSVWSVGKVDGYTYEDPCGRLVYYIEIGLNLFGE